MCAENVSGWVGCVWGSVTDCVTRRCFLCGCKRQKTWSLNVLCVTGNPRDATTTDHFPGFGVGGVCALGKKKKSKKKGNRGGWDGGQGPARERAWGGGALSGTRGSRVWRRVSGSLSAAPRSSFVARCVSSVLTDRTQGSASFQDRSNARSGELSALPFLNQDHSLDPGH